MWVSTGNAGSPKACAMTTLAVLCPTPGNASSSTKERGTSPPWRSISSCESREMAFAFWGDSPQGRMTSWMRATGTFAMACGVSASAQSLGVTSLTRLSVHCAESSTATSNV